MRRPPASIGDVFGCRTVIALLPNHPHHGQMAICRCRCGHEAPARVASLASVRHENCAGCVTEQPEKRFWSKVDKNGPIPAHQAELGACWIWTAQIGKDGYGRFQLRAGRPIRAHRYAFDPTAGDLPSGLFVCHRCDNKRCVNPGHLFLGTPADNMADMAAKGRSCKGEANRGAKLTSDQVVEILALHATGLHTQSTLADRFGIASSQINNIVRRKQWRHVG